MTSLKNMGLRKDFVLMLAVAILLVVIVWRIDYKSENRNLLELVYNNPDKVLLFDTIINSTDDTKNVIDIKFPIENPEIYIQDLIFIVESCNKISHIDKIDSENSEMNWEKSEDINLFYSESSIASKIHLEISLKEQIECIELRVFTLLKQQN